MGTFSTGHRWMRKKCKTEGCNNDAIPKRTRCSKCKMRAWREANPLRRRYRVVADRASRRGIPFTLTFKEFKKVVGEADLEGNHLDRIDPCKGYEAGNVQLLSASENVIKGNRERRGKRYLYHLEQRHAEITKREEDYGQSWNEEPEYRPPDDHPF